MTNCKDMEKGCHAHPCKPCVQVNVNPCCCHGKCCCGEDENQGRIMLDSDLIIYVRKDGNDNNDGLTDSPCGAKLTITNALRSLFRFDAQGYAMKIIIHEGEYEEALAIGAAYNSIGFASLTLQAFEGETVNVTQNTAQDTIAVRSVNEIFLNRLTVINNSSGRSCIYINCAKCTCKDCGFTSSKGAIALLVDWLAFMYIQGNTVIDIKNAACAIKSQNNAAVFLTGTIRNNSVNVSNSYLIPHSGGLISIKPSPATSFTGTVSGKKYHADYNGTLYTGGVAIPGSTGTTANGGVAA